MATGGDPRESATENIPPIRFGGREEGKGKRGIFFRSEL